MSDRPFPVHLPGPLPHFLIIGAMKAGTTTLYDDLTRHPGLYLPPEKEPEDLLHPAVETAPGLAAYSRKFAAAPKGALLGEASTSYTKRPLHEGVAARAVQMLGPRLKIIYLTRDPVDRAVSQYRHLVGLRLEDRPMEEAFAQDPTYAAFSRYDWQLAPWRAVLPDRQIHVLAFEDYIADRQTQLTKVTRFLGVAPMEAGQGWRNRSLGKRVAEADWLARVIRSRAYLYRIKPLLPAWLRGGLKHLLLPQAPAADVLLTAEMRARLIAALDQDPLAHERLKEAA